MPSFRFDHSLNHQIQSQPLILDSDTSSQPSSFVNSNQQPPQQPPVYIVSKSDFKDVVQKLTGSPAHKRVANTAARELHASSLVKPQSSRLQRISPPPLEHVRNSPPGGGSTVVAGNPGFFAGQQMMSPLPAVHATAESPISAYMRYEHGNPVSLKAQDDGDHMTINRDYAWLMISRQSISSITRVKDQANILKVYHTNNCSQDKDNYLRAKAIGIEC
nr:VQ motif-containing protein 9-like [Tanacetum cinerariifolium]